MKKQIIRAWDQFWFGPVGLYRLAIFRILFSFLAFLVFSIRHLNLEVYYSDTGILPLEKAKELFLSGYRSPLFWFPQDYLQVQLLHFGLLFSLIMLGLGFYSRFWALVALYIHLLFFQRNVTVIFGTDKIISFCLFYLIFSQSDRLLSLRTWLFPKHRLKISNEIWTPMAHRLFQIQICLVYAYSGLEKFKGSTWWIGSSLWSILTNGEVMPFDIGFVAKLPGILAIMTWTVLVWEAYFPMAVWVKPLRKYWLTFGVLFHLSVALTMNLFSFSLIMIFSYLFFLEDEKVASVFRKHTVRVLGHLGIKIKPASL